MTPTSGSDSRGTGYGAGIGAADGVDVGYLNYGYPNLKSCSEFVAQMYPDAVKS